MFLAKFEQFVEKSLSLRGDAAQLVAHEQFEVDEYLVVARAPRVYFFTNVAKFCREHELYLRVHVFNTFVDSEIAFFDYGGNLLQAGEEFVEFVF